MKGVPQTVSLLGIIGLWWICSIFFGNILIPEPTTVFSRLVKLGISESTWITLSITIARGLGGLGLALIAALFFGVLAGCNATVMKMLNPPIAAMQSCPPIIWITLLMVWAGTGSTVTLLVVFVTVFPPLFANIAQGCLSLDKRLFDMAQAYRLPRHRILFKLILPGMTPYLMAGLSYAASACWKITAVAEFFSASEGIGARIYWAYRMLEMTDLFAWATIVIILGVTLELTVIGPLRETAEVFTGNIREHA